MLINKKVQNEWKSSEDGRAYIESFVPYEDLDEFYRDLSKIEKLDYTSDKTTMEQAIEHSKQIATVFVRAKNLDLISERVNVMNALVILGCVPYKMVNKKLKENNSSSLDDSAFEESAVLPLTLYSNILSIQSYDWALGIMCDGGMDSLLGEWLITQKMAEGKNKQKI